MGSVSRLLSTDAVTSLNCIKFNGANGLFVLDILTVHCSLIAYYRRLVRQCLAHTNDTVLFCPCRPCELGIPHKEFREELHDDTQTKRVVLSAFEITWNIGCRVVSYKYRNWHFIFYAEATVKVNKRNPTKITLLRTGLLWRIGLFDILTFVKP